MTEMHDALIKAVANANEVVLDAEKEAQRRTENRAYLANLAQDNGVPIEELAAGLGQPLATVREWVRTGSE